MTKKHLGDVSLFVGAEVRDPDTTAGIRNTVFHSVETCPVSRPAKSPDQDPVTFDPWTFMPVNGYFNPNDSKQSVAMSTDPSTWPTRWPDKMNDNQDPGWGGSWNGYFTKGESADLESYFVMDDNNDKRFNYSQNNLVNGVRHSFKPDATNPSRNGLGLEVKVRGLQWGDFLAQDNIFWLYEITNTGTTTYDRAVFGMLVGTLVGVSGKQDFGEWDDDWSFYDAVENITYTGDYPRENTRNPFWVNPYNVGMVGYAFLESPGNPFDGIDNDGDVDRFVKGSLNPFFTQKDFDSVLVKAGDRVVLIDDNFNRKLFTVPNVDTITVYTRGAFIKLQPGKTKLSEGGLYTATFGGDSLLSPNAYDGIDNNLNGLIDENVQVHYRQVKYGTDRTKKLIDILRPVRHRNYLTSLVDDPYSMIDERRDDRIDNNRNWDIRFDDLGIDGKPGTQDQGEGDGLPTSGYRPDGTDTKLPGEPHIDKTDVDESDQIGLTSFYYFSPAGQVPLADKEELWRELAPGFFSVPASIDNNKPIGGEDGDFIYGSGYFPLVAKGTERFSLALVYGGGNGGSRDDDIADLLKHKRIVQIIYNANYQFPTPPKPAPTLTAVAGDGKVHLYWDRKSEDFVDPVLREKTFEGYKIFKSTDAQFNDAFDVTNALGVKKGYVASFQVDLVDTISGFYRAPRDIYQPAEGFTYYLGNNTGLVHDTTDYEIYNGRTYYYVIVAYTKGREGDSASVFPAQNKWKIDFDQFGRVRSTSANVAIVTPGTKAPGYTTVPGKNTIRPVDGTATGTLGYRVVDQTKLTGHTYVITFNDTRDSGKFVPITTSYSVLDTVHLTDIVQPSDIDTLPVALLRQNLVPSTFQLTELDGTEVPAAKYILNAERGSLRAKKSGDLQPSNATTLKKYKIHYQYYPVYKSLNISGSTFAKETKDADIFDGVELVLKNDWKTQLIDTLSGFSASVGDRKYSYSFTIENIADVGLFGEVYPADYDLIFSNSIVDTTYDFNGNAARIPVNFRLYNRTDKKFPKVVFVGVTDPMPDSIIGPGDKLFIFDRDTKDSLRYTWELLFSTIAGKKDTIYHYGAGDTLKIRIAKSFRKGDIYQFTTELPTVQTATIVDPLSRIRVVPNPYVVQTSQETPPPTGVFGRGQRKIDFINIPVGAKISIFTSRGEHIRTLYQDGAMTDGTVSWDVKTKENLDVAFGVYFYVVESTLGQKTGKLAIIK
ncbi:MAG: hypothetical protein NTV54_00740 [Ignavibacteriales bacterium]|nr:hypothetical protein [Ignavibacteriales bacterium]